MERMYRHLFEPLTIRGVRFRNRLFTSPNSLRMKTYIGAPTQDEITFFEDKAKGGAGAVTVGEAMVNYHYLREGRSFHFDLRNVNNHPMFCELSNAISIHGAVPSIQLTHPGMGADAALSDGLPIFGPSDCTRADGTAVHGMSEEQIEQAIEDYACAAAAARDCGFQMLQIHGGHGWLIGQFLSPLFNHRTDRWGGTLENRARFALQVLDQVRQRVGPRVILDFRISGDELVDGGMHIQDMVEFAKLIEDKVDILHVSAGLHDRPETNYRMFPQTEFTEHGCNVPYAAAMKEAGIRTLIATVGGISTPEQAEQILASGQADIVCMGRALIADPELPNKAREGHPEQIRPCLRCSECLIGLQYSRFGCQVNPRVGHELRDALANIAAPEKKRVVVIGGGPAGMTAAITAAEHGHEVTLIEQQSALGGQMNHADFDEKKADLRSYRDYLRTRTMQLVKNILLNTKADRALVASLQPDVIVAAAGASPVVPRVEGIEQAHVMDAVTAYRHMDDRVGSNVVIIGGGLVGCELSLLLARRGRRAVIVEMTDRVGDPVNWRHTQPMLEQMKRSGLIDVKKRSSAVRIEPDAVVIQSLADGTQTRLPCDTVIYSIGLRPNSRVADEMQDAAKNVIVVGDCRATGKIMGAVHGAYYACLNLR